MPQLPAELHQPERCQAHCVRWVFENKICVGQAETQAESTPITRGGAFQSNCVSIKMAGFPLSDLKMERKQLTLCASVLRVFPLSCPFTMNGCFQQEIRMMEDVGKCQVQLREGMDTQ